MNKWIQLQSADGLNNLFPVGKMDLLWQNANPTSAFTAQTFTSSTLGVDLADYDMFLISFNGAGYQSTLTDTARQYNIYFPDGKQGLLYCGTSSSVWGSRAVTVTTTPTIEIQGGYYIGTSGGTANNYASVPKEIYGIKLEIDDIR